MTAVTNTSAPSSLNIQDYFDAVKNGNWKNSVTADGKLASASEKKSNGSMDKNDFMHLLVTQLQYQDPTAPSDNQQMAAQLAQYSALEAMQGVQKSVDGIGTTVTGATGAQTSATNAAAGASAASLLGRNVTIKQGSLALSGSASAALTLKAFATDSLVLKDSSGKVVKTMPLSGSNSDGSPIIGANGIGRIVVDPIDDQGKPIQGVFSVDVVDAAGKSSGCAFAQGAVSGLEFREGAPYLTISGTSYKMSDLLAVSAS